MKISLKQLVKDNEEIIAFGFASGSRAYYTVRDSIQTAQPELQAEVPDVWGCSWAELRQAALDHCDLDRRYYPIEVAK